MKTSPANSQALYLIQLQRKVLNLHLLSSSHLRKSELGFHNIFSLRPLQSTYKPSSYLNSYMTKVCVSLPFIHLILFLPQPARIEIHSHRMEPGTIAGSSSYFETKMAPNLVININQEIIKGNREERQREKRLQMLIQDKSIGAENAVPGERREAMYLFMLRWPCGFTIRQHFFNSLLEGK